MLLRYRHQADTRPAGRAETETASCQDHHRPGALLLRVLAPLRSGDLRGRSAAPGGHPSELQAGGCVGRVAGGD